MRITNAMMSQQAISDMASLKERYVKAQNAVNGRALERPSDDPQRVVEAMDLSGMTLRLERARRSGEDAKEWLQVSESTLSAMMDGLGAARDIAVQAGAPGSQGPDQQTALANAVDSIRRSLISEMNTKHRDQYIFAGFSVFTPPYNVDPATGAAVYSGGTNQDITRDVAPGLSLPVNISGERLTDNGKADFIKTLSDMAADLRAGRVDPVIKDRLAEIDKAFSNLNVSRSQLGTYQVELESYQGYAQETSLHIEERLSKLTGTDLEKSVLEMTQAQSAYQTALASFSKTLPSSLVDYMR